MAETTEMDITQRLIAITPPEPSEQVTSTSQEESDGGSGSQTPVVPSETNALAVSTTTDKPSKKLVEQKPARKKKAVPARAAISPTNISRAYMLKERCRQLALALFDEEQTTLRSLGITSAIEGEGKSFLAILFAQVLAEDGIAPVTLIECNWQHPSLHEFFGIAAGPGLAEWLRGECDISEIRHTITPTLTVIPAGTSSNDAIKLLHQLRQRGIKSMMLHPDERSVLDLPAVLTSAYGSLAAGLAEALLMVVRAGVTPAPMLEEALGHLNDLPVKSVILNQVESKIPQWIRRLL